MRLQKHHQRKKATPPSPSRSQEGCPILDVGVADEPNFRCRPTMEDSHVVQHGLGASSHTGVNKCNDNNTGYFAVYDGHGGRAAVDFIEQNLHKSLEEELRKRPVPKALEQAFLNTDSAMAHDPRYQQCGSTVAAALVRPSENRVGGRDLFVANVGDARAVIALEDETFNDKSGRLRAQRLSRDHNPTYPAEVNRVKRAGGEVYNGRVNGMLAVSRALGDHALKDCGVTGSPDLTEVSLNKRHKFMIVACDGLWDVVTDDEAVQYVKNVKDPKLMAKKLVDLAMRNGTTDNVSVMAIRLQK